MAKDNCLPIKVEIYTEDPRDEHAVSVVLPNACFYIGMERARELRDQLIEVFPLSRNTERRADLWHQGYAAYSRAEIAPEDAGREWLRGYHDAHAARLARKAREAREAAQS